MIRLAREAGSPGWFDKPLCIFHEIPERLGVSDSMLVGEYERLVLISELVKEIRDGPLSKARRPADFVSALDQLIGEMLGEGIEPAALSDALVASNAASSEHDTFSAARDANVLAVYRAYREKLQAIGRVDRREALVRAARDIASGQLRIADRLGGRREIRIFGLADLRGGWRALLAALAGSPELDRVTVYTSATMDFGGLPVTTESLDEPISIAALLFNAVPDVRPIALSTVVNELVAPDLEREMDAVAVGIRTLIDGNVPPHRIAIVTRRARPHVDEAIKSLARVGVPATARQRIGLREVPVIRAVSALMDAASEGWTRYGLSHLARNPYLACDVDPRVIDFTGYERRVTGLAQWRRALDELAERARRNTERDEAARRDGVEVVHDRAEGRHVRLPELQDIAGTRDAFAAFSERARILDVPRAVADWLDWLNELLTGDAWGVAASASQLECERYDIIRRDSAALNNLAQIAREWCEALRTHCHDGDPISIAEFRRMLAPCLEGDLAFGAATTFGVQVLEAPAAAYRSFEHTFLVGMQAGAFPTVPNRSAIWDDSDRECLRSAGLPLDGRDAWEMREQELFRSIVAGARTGLTLSHSRMDDTGREIIRSVFVEEMADFTTLNEIDIATSTVTVPGIPLYDGALAPTVASHAAQVERIRASRQASAYDGAIGDPDLVRWLATEFGDDRLWSPTQLEELAKCPWAFMSKRLLRLQKREDPDEDMDNSVRGTILHAALARFYDRALKRSDKPVFLLSADSTWAAESMESCLDDAITDQGRAWLCHPSLREAKRSELIRILQGFLQWEIQLHEDMIAPKTRKVNAPKMIRTGVIESELAFDNMIFERDGVRIRYRGTIDRVEVSVDERLGDTRMIAAADYKTTKGSTPGGGDKKAWAAGVVLQVPLYAYALSQIRRDDEVARVEYLTLKTPDSVLGLQLYTFNRKSNEVEPDATAVDQWTDSLNHAIDHVRKARQGQFPARPPETCGCPAWCHGIDICRIPRSEVKK